MLSSFSRFTPSPLYPLPPSLYPTLFIMFCTLSTSLNRYPFTSFFLSQTTSYILIFFSCDTSLRSLLLHSLVRSLSPLFLFLPASWVLIRQFLWLLTFFKCLYLSTYHVKCCYFTHILHVNFYPYLHSSGLVDLLIHFHPDLNLLCHKLFANLFPHILSSY